MSIKNVIRSTFALLLLISSVSLAQQDQRQRATPEQRAQRQMNWMQNNLSLSSDQSKKVSDILSRYAQQADQLMGEQPGPDKKQARMQMQQNKDAELKGVLTGNQYQIYVDHEQQMKDRMMQQRGSSSMPPNGNSN